MKCIYEGVRRHQVPGKAPSNKDAAPARPTRLHHSEPSHFFAVGACREGLVPHPEPLQTDFINPIELASWRGQPSRTLSKAAAPLSPGAGAAALWSWSKPATLCEILEEAGSEVFFFPFSIVGSRLKGHMQITQEWFDSVNRADALSQIYFQVRSAL